MLLDIKFSSNKKRYKNLLNYLNVKLEGTETDFLNLQHFLELIQISNYGLSNFFYEIAVLKINVYNMPPTSF